MSRDPDPPGDPLLPKEDLRRLCRRRRRQHLPAAADGILAAARRELPRLLPSAGHVGLWWPLRGEPDLLPLAEDLAGRVALPVILPSRRLVYRSWQPGDRLEADGCGIPAPPGGPGGAPDLDPGSIALLLVPALAVDHHGVRLGSGGGWYDRLRSDPRWSAVPALAVLPAACVVPVLPRDRWDVPFHGWLDETGCHRLQRKVAGS